MGVIFAGDLFIFWMLHILELCGWAAIKGTLLVASAKFIYKALLAVWCQPKSLLSEEFCKELKKGRTTPYLLGYTLPFYTSRIYVLPLLGVAILEQLFISLAPILSHLAFLPRTSKLAGAMLEICLFMHLPEAWKYGHAHFF